MTLWICTTCGAAEHLTFYPDCCSCCGGGMETQDGRFTSTRDDDEALFEAAAVHGDETAIVLLWHRGHPLTPGQRHVLDDLRLSESIAALTAVYGGLAA